MNKGADYFVPLIWLLSVSCHLLLLALTTLTSLFHDTPIEGFGVTALIVPYMLNQIGLPVLENNGLSGGGLPSPNLFGWFISITTWLVFYWLLISGIKRLIRNSSVAQDKHGAP